MTISAPVRPAIGARMVAYCNCTFAFSTAARSAPTMASSAAAFVRAVSRCSRVPMPRSTRSSMRCAMTLCVGELRGIALQIRFGLMQRRFERPMIEREQHLARLNVVALAGS